MVGDLGGQALQGYKVPNLPGMIAEPLRMTDKFKQTGSTHPSFK